jgi:serine/threonine protein kinase
MPLTPESILNGRYRIISILGQGGMGAVYRAEDVHLHTPIAVKENLFLTSEYSRQFEREATIMARLRHRHLPRVRDFFDNPGQGQYLVMDFIEGEDLRQRIERLGTIPEVDVILIGAAICEAIQYLHTRVPAIIHRDIKPGNIKITPEGEVYLVDFGLAKMVMGNQATTTGARAMTPGYSPPEQYGTARTDARSDIYSLGATLYAAMTGKIPEDGLTRATEKANLTPIRRHLPHINPELADVIERALEVDPEDRYQSADEMRNDLLEAGEMTNMLVTPPTISAPPDFSIPPVEELENGVARNGVNKSSTNRNTRRRFARLWKRHRAAILSTAGILITIFLLILVLQPQLTPAGSSEGTSTATATTSITTSQPNPTSTLEPTGTITPEASATTPPSSPTPLVAGPGATNQAQIIFASNRTGVPQLWLMNSDGSNQTQMTNMPDGACKPSWSPDGMEVAFISPCLDDRDIYSGSRIYILNLNDNTIKPLGVNPSPEGDFDPAWSPDGKKIAFASKRNGFVQIYAYNLETGILNKLTNTETTEIQPRWSSNGSQIAYVHWIVFSQIWIMSDSGSKPTQFSMSGEINNFWPTWSSSNDRIYYGQKQSSAPLSYITTMRYEDRGTFKSTRIPSQSPASGAQPIAEISLSTDGEWFVFKSWPDGVNHDIYMMDVNGANWSRLTTDPGYDFSPAWRPQH